MVNIIIISDHHHTHLPPINSHTFSQISKFDHKGKFHHHPLHLPIMTGPPTFPRTWKVDIFTGNKIILGRLQDMRLLMAGDILDPNFMVRCILRMTRDVLLCTLACLVNQRDHPQTKGGDSLLIQCTTETIFLIGPLVMVLFLWL